MKTILLYGALGKKFGKKHMFDVKDPSEAIRALSAVIKGFKKHMIEDRETGYNVFVGSNDLYIDEIMYPTSDKEVIRIVPAMSGSGNKVKIVVGVILIALASYYGGPQTGAEVGSAFFSWGTVTQIGIVLVLTGVAGLIFEQKIEENELADDNPNYVFDGVVNTTRQGNPVPVGYGTLRVGSQVISAGLSIE